MLLKVEKDKEVRMGHCISDNTNNEERFKTVKLVSKHNLDSGLTLNDLINFALFLFSMTKKATSPNFTQRV